MPLESESRALWRIGSPAGKMAWRTLATFRRKARGSQAAGGEERESMEHPKFEKELGCLPQLRSSEVFGGPQHGG
jgi:hypothetical protein